MQPAWMGTMAPSHVQANICGAGITTKAAEKRKRLKYAKLCTCYSFESLAVDYGFFGAIIDTYSVASITF